jgi:hypothetical protein
MELRITLSPTGGLRLILPQGRPLDIGFGPSTMHFIHRILTDAAKGKRDQRGYIGEFPTQHVIDIWRKQDTAAREATKLEAAAAKKDELRELGIDLDRLDIRL